MSESTLRFSIVVDGADDAARSFEDVGTAAQQMGTQSSSAAGGMDDIGLAAKSAAKDTKGFGTSMATLGFGIASAVSSTVGLIRSFENISRAQDKATAANTKLERANLAVEKAQKAYNDALAGAGPNTEAVAKASNKLASANIGLEKAQLNVVKAQRDYNSAFSGAIDLDKRASATINLAQANLGLESAELKVKDAQSAYNAALSSGGPNSEKAEAAAKKLDIALRAQADAAGRAENASENVGFAWANAGTDAIQFGAGIGSIVSSIGTAKTAFSGLSASISGLSPILGKLGVAATIAFGAFAVGTQINDFINMMNQLKNIDVSGAMGSLGKMFETIKNFQVVLPNVSQILGLFGINFAEMASNLQKGGPAAQGTIDKMREMKAAFDSAIGPVNVFVKEFLGGFSQVQQKLQSGDIAGALAQIPQVFGSATAAIGHLLDQVASKVDTALGGIPSKIGQAFAGAAAAVGSALAPVGQAITQAFSGVVAFVTPIWQAIEHEARRATSNIAAVFSGIGAAIGQGFQGIVSFVTPIWQALEHEARRATSNIAAVFSAIGAAIAQGFQGVIAAVTPVWQGLEQAARRATSAIGGVFSAIGQAIAQGFQGVVAAVTPVWQALEQAARRTTSQIGGVFSAIGQAISQGFQGVVSAVAPVWQALQDGARRATSMIGGAFGPMGQAIGQTFQGAVGIVSGIWRAIEDAVASSVNRIVHALSFLKSQWDRTVAGMGAAQISKMLSGGKRHGGVVLATESTSIRVGEGFHPELVVGSGSSSIGARRGATVVTKPTNVKVGEGMKPEVISVTPLTGPHAPPGIEPLGKTTFKEEEKLKEQVKKNKRGEESRAAKGATPLHAQGGGTFAFGLDKLFAGTAPKGGTATATAAVSMELENKDTFEKDTQELGKAFGTTIPKEWSTEVTADTKGANASVSAFGKTINAIPKEKETEIDADDRGATTAINSVKRALDTLPSSKTIKINITNPAGASGTLSFRHGGTSIIDHPTNIRVGEGFNPELVSVVPFGKVPHAATGGRFVVNPRTKQGQTQPVQTDEEIKAQQAAAEEAANKEGGELMDWMTGPITELTASQEERNAALGRAYHGMDAPFAKVEQIYDQVHRVESSLPVTPEDQRRIVALGHQMGPAIDSMIDSFAQPVLAVNDAIAGTLEDIAEMQAEIDRLTAALESANALKADYELEHQSYVAEAASLQANVWGEGGIREWQEYSRQWADWLSHMEHAATGFGPSIVRKPTMFLTGEAGPEMVEVTPLAKGTRGGGGGGGNSMARVEALLEKLVRKNGGGMEANLVVDGQRMASVSEKYVGVKSYGDR